MKELIDKLSSYNLFNYLLPGILFAAGTEMVGLPLWRRGDILSDLFLYYVAGLVISRLGSLLVGPALQKIGLVKPHESYPDFVKACGKDSKIETLSEQNNMYRSLCTLFI